MSIVGVYRWRPPSELMAKTEEGHGVIFTSINIYWIFTSGTIPCMVSGYVDFAKGMQPLQSTGGCASLLARLTYHIRAQFIHFLPLPAAIRLKLLRCISLSVKSLNSCTSRALYSPIPVFLSTSVLVSSVIGISDSKGLTISDFINFRLLFNPAYLGRRIYTQSATLPGRPQKNTLTLRSLL